MTLAPLVAASPAIKIHLAVALAAFGLGLVQFAAPKGTFSHRTLGYAWSALMLVTAGGSFWIHAIDQWRGYSLIHVLSVITLVSVPFAIWQARHHRVGSHKRVMILLFTGG